MRLRYAQAFCFVLLAVSGVCLDVTRADEPGAANAVSEPPGKSYFLIYDAMVSDIVGSTVYSLLGEELGTVEDLVIKADDKVTYAVLSRGDGFLGFGDQLVLLPYSELLLTKGKRIYVDLDPREIRRAATLQRTEFGPMVQESAPESETGEPGGRIAYEEEWERRMTRWQTKITQRSQRMVKTPKRARKSADDTMDTAWSSVSVAWANLRESNDQAWGSARSNLETRWDEFEDAWSQAAR